MVQMLVKAYAPDIDKALGIYLPLIVVNCIILGRAEMYASKHSVLPSVLDAWAWVWALPPPCWPWELSASFFGTGAVFGVPIFQGVIDPIIVFILLVHYVSDITAQLLQKPARSLAILGFMPFVYYIFDYMTSKYTLLLLFRLKGGWRISWIRALHHFI